MAYGGAGVSHGARLMEMAGNLSEEIVQRLYVEGKGYWSCMYPHSSSSSSSSSDGSSSTLYDRKVIVRSCVDFLYIGRGIGDLLPTK